MDLALFNTLADARKLTSDTSPEEIAAVAARLLIAALRKTECDQKHVDFLETDLDYTLHWKNALKAGLNQRRGGAAAG